MDTQSKELFDSLVAMDKEALTTEQKAFLMARRPYFNDEQRKRYADLIEEHEAGIEESTEKPSKKSKRGEE